MNSDRDQSEESIDTSVSFLRFSRHMPETEDASLVVLKGHLLIEAEINDMLALHWQNPSALKDARLQFAQRVALLKALTEPDTLDARTSNAIRILNELRNAFAHHLESEKVPRLIEDFCALYKPLGAREANSSDAKRIGMCIGFLCGQLDDRKEELADKLRRKRPA